MALPSLLTFQTEIQYKQYFIDNYCNKSPILTFDQLPVRFYPNMFEHSFYKRSTASWQAPKDILDMSRCERMDWIKAVLQDPTIVPHVGYDKAKNSYDKSRRVSFLAPNNYLVVIQCDQNNIWRFTTAYIVDNTRAATKITSSPIWVK